MIFAKKRKRSPLLITVILLARWLGGTRGWLIYNALCRLLKCDAPCGPSPDFSRAAGRGAAMSNCWRVARCHCHSTRSSNGSHIGIRSLRTSGTTTAGSVAGLLCVSLVGLLAREPRQPPGAKAFFFASFYSCAFLVSLCRSLCSPLCLCRKPPMNPCGRRTAPLDTRTFGLYFLH